MHRQIFLPQQIHLIDLTSWQRLLCVSHNIILEFIGSILSMPTCITILQGWLTYIQQFLKKPAKKNTPAIDRDLKLVQVDKLIMFRKRILIHSTCLHLSSVNLHKLYIFLYDSWISLLFMNWDFNSLIFFSSLL